MEVQQRGVQPESAENERHVVDKEIVVLEKTQDYQVSANAEKQEKLTLPFEGERLEEGIYKIGYEDDETGCGEEGPV